MRIVVGLSGGVDSSLAAALLRERGFDVVAVYLKFDRQARRADGTCAWEDDVQVCRRVAALLDIPFVVRDVTDAYEERVLAPMTHAYRFGLTPNPDIDCNRAVKLDELFAVARSVGAPAMATGHYARIRSLARGRIELLRGVDHVKDQSYFLWACAPTQLSALMFPVGNYTKAQVRAMARSRGLPNWDRHSTRGVCFLGAPSISEYLAARIPPQPATVQSTSGVPVGSVPRTHGYTIGQRARIGGQSAAQYVVSIDTSRGVLTVSDGASDPARWRRMVRGTHARWIGRVPPPHFTGEARIRHRQDPEPCVVSVCGDRVDVEFDRGQLGVAPGQAMVLSIGDRVLGGAWIDSGAAA